MKGNFGCKQCQCTPEDSYCSCLCHENELANQNECKHKRIEKCFVGQACGERCLDCGKEWRSTWQGD